MDGSPKGQGHKEQTKSFINSFNNDCDKVFLNILTNPFSNSTFSKLNSAYIFPDEVVKDVRKVFTLGEEQYFEFRRTRFILGTDDIIDSKIKKTC